MRFHLAQVNLAYARAPIEDPLLADFVARIDEINALAEISPGFVWRYRSDAGYPRELGDPRVLFNMSVWESVEALHAFTYRSVHTELFAARRKWFGDVKESIGLVSMGMWWVPAGELVKGWANRHLGALERWLEGREFIATNELTVADILMSHVLCIVQDPALLEPYPRVRAYRERCMSRSAWKKTLEAYDARVQKA